jgi:DNA-binding IclR family transcriptional regulator
MVPYSNTASRDTAQPPSIKILDKTLLVLSLFTREAPEWGVTEMAARSGLPKSTVYRVLRVLLHHEYLTQDPLTKRFRLGLGALELGRRAYEGLELRHVAADVLDRIAALTGETVLLEVLNQERDRVVCIERAQRRSGLHLILDVGSTAPLHAGASSKVLLAFLPEEEIERVIARGLTPLTRHTIADPDLLRRDLDAVRRHGYALSFEETDEGAAGLAVPIRDRTGQVVAGLTIAGPITRLNRATLLRFLDLARDGARQIEREIGFAGWGPGAMVLTPPAGLRRAAAT